MILFASVRFGSVTAHFATSLQRVLVASLIIGVSMVFPTLARDTSESKSGVPICRRTQLRLHFTSVGEAGMSHNGRLLTLVNVSKVTCSLRGLPNVRFLDTRHQTLASTYAQVPTLRTFPSISLTPSAVAYANLRWLAANVFAPNTPARCVRPAYLSLTISRDEGPILTTAAGIGVVCGPGTSTTIPIATTAYTRRIGGPGN
jgi:Protein of unknown function (DUF4232)